ncbi:MAG: endonuclease III [Deltaproteobacteria bacterium]|nr:endonuclease III [Candidatus Zymogenaceae bacterium]
MPPLCELIDALNKHFGAPVLNHPKDPLSELIFTILSQNTTDTNRDRAYERLRKKFPRWRDVLEADREEVEEAIRTGGLGRQKSTRIQEILRTIDRKRGKLNMDYLAEMSVDEAREELLSFTGVGRKTAAIVLLFSLGRPAFPVDTHVHRVGTRLGLIPEKMSADAAHDVMERLVPPSHYYDFHINLIRLGRTVCGPRRIACESCPALGWCPTGLKKGDGGGNTVPSSPD